MCVECSGCCSVCVVWLDLVAVCACVTCVWHVECVCSVFVCGVVYIYVCVIFMYMHIYGWHVCRMCVWCAWCAHNIMCGRMYTYSSMI